MIGPRHLVTGCLLLLPAAAARAGTPYDYGLDITASLARRQNNSSERILVTNLWDGPRAETPARVELRELKADRYRWDLYVLALSMFHWTDPDAADSWYQVAGKVFPFSLPPVLFLSSRFTWAHSCPPLSVPVYAGCSLPSLTWPWPRGPTQAYTDSRLCPGTRWWV
jgi:hypothetical protein